MRPGQYARVRAAVDTEDRRASWCRSGPSPSCRASTTSRWWAPTTRSRSAWSRPAAADRQAVGHRLGPQGRRARSWSRACRRCGRASKVKPDMVTIEEGPARRRPAPRGQRGRRTRQPGVAGHGELLHPPPDRRHRHLDHHRPARPQLAARAELRAVPLPRAADDPRHRQRTRAPRRWPWSSRSRRRSSRKSTASRA